jgi:hypothetical protein
MTSQPVKHYSTSTATDYSQVSNFGYYLAGLIESDGYIYVPLNSLRKYAYPYIIITFHFNDFPLLMKIKEILNTGVVTAVKGKNAYRLSIQDVTNVLNLIQLINGKFRTPKVLTLHKLIQWYKDTYSYNIPLLPIDTTPLENNAWLAGFSDGDCSLYVR